MLYDISDTTTNFQEIPLIVTVRKYASTINGRKLNTDTSEKIGVCTKSDDYQQVL